MVHTNKGIAYILLLVLTDSDDPYYNLALAFGIKSRGVLPRR